jgi:hypothetical protein
MTWDPTVGVRQFRVVCNHPVTPTSVTLLVVAHRRQRPDQREWDRIYDLVHAVAGENGIALVGPELTSLDDMTAHDYLASALITATESS